MTWTLLMVINAGHRGWGAVRPGRGRDSAGSAGSGAVSTAEREPFPAGTGRHGGGDHRIRQETRAVRAAPGLNWRASGQHVSAGGRVDGMIAISRVASPVDHFSRSLAVLPDVRFLFSLFSGYAAMPKASAARGSPRWTAAFRSGGSRRRR